MNKYTFRIYAREIGAIGVWQHFTLTVEANTREEAELKLYEKYEHIHGKDLVNFSAPGMPEEVENESN